jgi:outer membrane PBP1 activator LpoA protein
MKQIGRILLPVLLSAILAGCGVEKNNKNKTGYTIKK